LYIRIVEFREHFWYKRKMCAMLRMEFHCHTYHSADSLARPEALLAACRKKGVDRLVITDHNSIAGALETRRLDPERFIVGEEIMTEFGELLAAFVKEELPRGLPALEAIRRLREQGAFISVSHPFDSARHGAWALDDLLAIAPLVDAIEVFNARCMVKDANRLAEAFAREHDLPGTAGSDAHAPFEVGRACLLLPPFEGPDGLRAVIRQGKVSGRLSSPWVHAVSRYARFRKYFRV
jgi:predicted metal-dependent phosphoesterase TrpH